MDIILNYLDSMFAALPDTEEVKTAKTEMTSMMEDKYLELKAEGKSENEAIGTVISEFGNIDELAAELDLTAKPAVPSAEIPEARHISVREGEKYIEDMANFGHRIGIGVLMCILSPIPLLLMAGWTDSDLFAVAGVIVLLVIVAAAVGIFITTGMELSKYNYLHDEYFVLEPSAEAVFTHRRDEAREPFGKRIAFGVGLCILGAAPLLLIGTISDDDRLICIAAAFLLLVVAFGVYQFIRYGMPFGCFDTLLRKDDYAHWKKTRTLTDKIAGIYWPLVVAVYLGYSFITNDWGRSWIIWPVAGVLFGAIAGICSAVSKEE